MWYLHGEHTCCDEVGYKDIGLFETLDEALKYAPTAKKLNPLHSFWPKEVEMEFEKPEETLADNFLDPPAFIRLNVFDSENKSERRHRFGIALYCDKCGKDYMEKETFSQLEPGMDRIPLYRNGMRTQIGWLWAQDQMIRRHLAEKHGEVIYGNV